MEKARAHLKNTSVYINEDFSERLRKKRAELLPAMREAGAIIDNELPIDAASYSS
uniref:GH10 domain-containing protein n=1 Tax=Anguilla anguilla TaxID=7936 RepID=A0A0E9XVX3_ANGAN